MIMSVPQLTFNVPFPIMVEVPSAILTFCGRAVSSVSNIDFAWKKLCLALESRKDTSDFLKLIVAPFDCNRMICSVGGHYFDDLVCDGFLSSCVGVALTLLVF